MANHEKRGRTAARLLAEGLMVVASILLAFALDAWWSERALRQEVVEDLVGIDQELAENVEAVRWQIDLMSRVVDAGEVLLGQLDASPSSTRLMAADTLAWFALMGISPTLDASLGGVDALIASGRLAAVRSTELRSRLAGLRARVEDAVEEQVLNRNTEYERMHPILDPVFDKGPLMDLVPDFFDERTLGRPVHGRGSVQVPNSLALRNVLRSRNGTMGVALGEMRSLLTEFSELRELIATETS